MTTNIPTTTNDHNGICECPAGVALHTKGHAVAVSGGSGRLRRGLGGKVAGTGISCGPARLGRLNPGWRRTRSVSVAENT